MDKDSRKSKQVILKHLVYYDIFNYPLSEKELLENCLVWDVEKEDGHKAITGLLQEGIIHEVNGFYSIRNNVKNVFDRLKGNELAIQWQKKADRFSRFISRFPFIRGVALSGSLSKGFLGEDPDIDYFIITEPGRLWLSRTLLILFKKVFLGNSHKYFCVNYFVDSEHLEIEEKNLFTATELTTMIPTYGNSIKQHFYDENEWVHEYYPRFNGNLKSQNGAVKRELLKNAFEKLFNNRLGNYLDTKLMNITLKYWRKKFKDRYSEKDFDLVFKTSKGISKHHPQNFQKKVLNQYQLKLDELAGKFNFAFDEDKK